MDHISQFRQMMADQKFSELQKLLEVQLSLQTDDRFDYLILYVETLQAQHKFIPIYLAIELAEAYSIRGEHSKALALLTNESDKFYLSIAKIKMKAAEANGQMSLLHTLISDLLVRQFENQNPVIPSWIRNYLDKYFHSDFSLTLKELSLHLLGSDLIQGEKLTKSLILGCIEKSSPRGIDEKLSLIGEVLKNGQQKAQLEIYQSYCHIAVKKELDKTDLKRLVEMVIFFDDFRFQVLVLNLLHKHKFSEEAQEYAESIKNNPDYSYVYFDKYFSDLKSYFFKFIKPKHQETEKNFVTPDLKLTSSFRPEQKVVSEVFDEDLDDNETLVSNLLKYQTYSEDQLCDLAVSFLQSELPRVALKASKLVIEQATDDAFFLKGSYLKLTSELQLKDYRAALDTCLNALSKATTRDDILSFLYGQADVYIRLDQKQQAKKILSKIISIDAKYRSAKERLDKLNEI